VESTTTDPPEMEEQLSLDLVFQVLKNQRRRNVLLYLKQHEDPASLGDLSEFIAAKENGKEEAALTSQERKRAYVGLYQCHLPMMDDVGVVDFNKDRGIISLTPRAEVLDSYLDGPSPSERPWSSYYLATAVLGVGLSALVFAVPAVPAEPLLLTESAVFGLLAAAHAVSEGLPSVEIPIGRSEPVEK
jgi:hypothetical protein